MPLTARRVETIKEPGRYADGKGLYLLVMPKSGEPTKAGSKSWVLRVQVNGRRRDFGLGSIDLLTLSEAREKAQECRKVAKAGGDPSKAARAARADADSSGPPTFKEAALAYHATVQKGWRNGKHQDQWVNTLTKYAFPFIGDKLVSEIDAPAIQAALVPIWLKVPETARRVRQRIATVLNYAHVKGGARLRPPCTRSIRS